MLFTYTVRSKKREELIDITNLLLDAIKRSGVNEGFAIIYAPHTTAAITINENADPTVKGDIINYLSKLIPKNYNYKHLEGNSDAHIKSSIIGCSEMIIIKDGKPILGTWQGLFFAEFDGPRERKVYIKIFEG
ncbi:secondary thiamine-phosphate synthase enzyme YjbQ [Methanocaldococcus villosus]|uniref:secondary thiamine-phosphate synthase enzyme YjbQ n=1 Tax=Methanocaldococcus villosus TaxID=667126 RepID=UPI00036B5044|nr:secondary thiamine-phosphate synthase enzyme YjbQ [Methanocaldococcus villosus]